MINRSMHGNYDITLHLRVRLKELIIQLAISILVSKETRELVLGHFITNNRTAIVGEVAIYSNKK